MSNFFIKHNKMLMKGYSCTVSNKVERPTNKLEKYQQQHEFDRALAMEIK